MKEHWIWLTRRKGLGPVKQRQLLEIFGSPEALWAADGAALARAGLSPSMISALADRSLDAALEILDRCQAVGVRVLTAGEPDFPRSLRDLRDGPLVLYLRGSLPEPEALPCVALVGARAADQRGLRMARQLGWQIAGCGGAVITGMARGIDAAAAGGALDRGGAVIGVLGCGPDLVYPPENADLFARVALRGCLLSEFPPGTKPNARFFPARNRIISALSDAVTVVQASGRSGALITAQWAAEQGRDVFAVPGPVGEDLSEGCNRLLKEGAILAECGWDILCEYEYRYPEAVREYHGRPPAPADRAAAPAVPARPSAPEKPRPESPASKGIPVPGDLKPEQRQIIAALAEGPLQLDALISRLDLPPARVLPQLTLLQMKGLILCRPGKIYQLA